MPDVVGMYASAGVRLRASDGATWVTTRCFAANHEDRHPSARVSLKSGGFRCFTCGAKGGAVAALELLGLSHHRAVEFAVDYGVLDRDPPPVSRRPWQFLKPPATAATTAAAREAQHGVQTETVAPIDWDALATETAAPARERKWVYDNERGAPVGRVHRLDLPDGSKRIFQERPQGDGWRAGLGGTQLPLYRLPELLRRAQGGERVLVVEGEKCVDALERLDVFATTNAGGAGKWRSDLTRHLHGAHVTVVSDCDWPGRCHAVDVTRQLLDNGVQATMPLELDTNRDDGYDLVDDLAELADTVRAVTPAIDSWQLRQQLRRNLLDRVHGLMPADHTMLDRHLERFRVDESPSSYDTLVPCIRCGTVRPHLLRMGLAYCVCGAPPTLAP